MHIHELNPWRTMIAVIVFVLVLIVGFITMKKPLLSYKLDMEQSVADVETTDYLYYPWDLEGFISGETSDVVLFDIRNNFVFGQGHIPGAENLSANDLAGEESIKRLEDLKDQNITVVLYGQDQLQANGPVMLFREVGLENVKVLAGGYQYYNDNKDDLYGAAYEDLSWEKEVPKYNYAEMAAPKDGSAISASTEKPTIEVTRRNRTDAAAGGC